VFEAVDSLNILDLVCTNFTVLKSVPADSGLVTPDIYHTPLSIDVSLPHVNNKLNCEFSYRIFAAGIYTLLYNILPTHDWSSVYETTSVDVAVTSLNVAVGGAMEQQFLMAIAAGPNSLLGFPITEGITLLRKIISTILKETFRLLLQQVRLLSKTRKKHH
jgi:hypothetical protein